LATLRPRLAAVAGLDVGVQGGVGVGDLLDDVLRGLRPEPVVGLDPVVGVPAQVVGAVAIDVVS
jgi:hypothetical protein